MRKFVFILALISILSGCSFEEESQEYVIKNSSSISVTIQISFVAAAGNDGSHTLAAGETLTRSYTAQPSIAIQNHARVSQTTSGNEITLSDATPYTANFFNASDTYTIVISEKTNSIGTYGDTVTVAPGAEVSASVYTLTPTFTAVYNGTSYPADCNTVLNSTTNVFYTTVR